MSEGSDSIYRPPESDLETTHTEPGSWGSVERALSGESGFEIQEVMREAWSRVPGSKGILWVIGVMAFGASMLAQAVVVALMTVGGASAEDSILAAVVDGVVPGLLGAMVAAPIVAGGWLYSIKRSVHDDSASINEVVAGFSRAVPIIGVQLLSTLMTYLGIALLILPGVYLAVAYAFAMPLVIEKNMGVWEAMETSRRAITRCWLRVFGFMIVVALVAGLGSALTLGVGLIWALPFLALAYAVVYRDLFGYDGSRA